jgi:hypothetical protein
MRSPGGAGCAGRLGFGVAATSCAGELGGVGLTAAFAVGLAFLSDARRTGAFFAGFFLTVVVFLRVASPVECAEGNKRRLPVPVPTANPRQLTDDGESVDSSLDERSLQFALVHLDWAVPIAGRVGSRNPRASASAQRSTPQLPEAGDS